MVAAFIRLDQANGTICLGDKLRVQISGRCQFMKPEGQTLVQYAQIHVGGYIEISLQNDDLGTVENVVHEREKMDHNNDLRGVTSTNSEVSQR